MQDKTNHTQQATHTAPLAQGEGHGGGASCGFSRSLLFTPSLLFCDGLAVSVLALTMVMLRRFGLGSADTAMTVSLLCLPLLLRPLFEMVVAHFWGTTKVWVLSAQLISAVSLAAVAFTLSTASWLYGIICFMPFFVSSAILYNIATHRFYVNEECGMRKNSTFHIPHSTFSLLFGIGIMTMVGGNMEVVTRNVRYSWSLVFYVMAGIELFFCLWHSIFLPGGPRGYIAVKPTLGLHRGEFALSVRRMLRRKNDIMSLAFLLLFLLPEAFLALIAPLFMIDKPHYGGLGLSPQEFALAQGTVAVIALAVGYMAGRTATRKWGQQRMAVLAAVVMTLHSTALLYLSYHATASLLIVGTALSIGTAALGFSLSVVKAVSQRFVMPAPDATLRHAIARTLLVTPFIIIGIFAGQILVNIGYRQFFTIAIYLYAIPLIVAVIYWLSNRRSVN